MTGATLFSGIGAPEQAMPWVQWRCCAEIEAFPSAVLTVRHPGVPNLGDVTSADFIERARALGPVDLIVFGSPCQSFSIAGRRLGLDDPRGNLALIGLGIIAALKPRWFLFENVPGLLSSDEGRDFGVFLGAMEECGYRGAWASLDAQFFGVAQRRERLFVVGYLGDWRPPCAVLLEPESLCRNSPPGRETREGVADEPRSGLAGCFQNTGQGWWNDADVAQTIRDASAGGASHSNIVAGTLGGGSGSRGWCDDLDRATFIPTATHTLTSNGDAHSGFRDEHGLVACLPFDTTQITSPACRSNNQYGDPCHTLASGGHPPAVAFNLRGRDGGAMPEVSEVASVRASSGGSSRSYVAAFDNRQGDMDEVTGTLRSNCHGANPMALQMGVRRLTPRETERLQGFPDGYTAISYRGKPAADGPRYKAIGNSMAVPVIRWIGERIMQVDSILEAA